jgi:hypothetical protein
MLTLEKFKNIDLRPCASLAYAQTHPQFRIFNTIQYANFSGFGIPFHKKCNQKHHLGIHANQKFDLLAKELWKNVILRTDMFKKKLYPSSKSCFTQLMGKKLPI